MIIEKINVKSFGLLTDTALEFSDTVNVIEGQNESGKSTIAAFIKYMLYGFGEESSEDVIDERNKRINWHTGTAQGSMTVRVKDKRYLITRSTAKNVLGGKTVYKDEASIVDLETGTPAFGRTPAGEVFFGVDRTLFENTAFIGALAEARVEENSVTEAIENILFSGSETQNHRRAVADIAVKMRELLQEDGSAGLIVDLLEKEKGIDERLKEAEANNKKVLETEAKLQKVRNAKEEAKKRLADLCDLDECFKNAKLIDSFDKLHFLEEEDNQKGETYRAFVQSEAINGFTPTDEYLTALRDGRRRFHDAYYALREAKVRDAECRARTGISNELENTISAVDGMAGEKTVADLATALRARKNRRTVGGVFATLVSIAALFFAFATAKMENVTMLHAAAAGVLAVGLIGTVAFFFLSSCSGKRLLSLAREFGTDSYGNLLGKMKMIGDARKKRNDVEEAKIGASDALALAEEKYKEAKDALTDLIARWEREMPTENLDDYLDRQEDKILRFLQKEKELKAACVEANMKVREAGVTLADKSEMEIRAKVPIIRRRALEGVDRDSIAVGIAECEKQIAEEDEKAAALEEELASLSVTGIDPVSIYSRKQFIDGKVEELRLQHKALYLAYKTIESASADLREEISPRLGTFTTEMLGVMTNHKYNDVDVSDGLKVTFAAADGEQKSVDFLSEGTKDLTYIAVRMALADMLYGEKPPLTFDESFAHQDNNRSRAMMSAIVHMAKEGCQSFIFTCRRREGALACELDDLARVFTLSVGTGNSSDF